MSRHSLTLMFVFAVVVLIFLRLPPMVAEQDSVLNNYRSLVEVDAMARERYVEPINDDRLIVGAMRGMLRQLDPYSAYLSAEQLAAFEARNDGAYIGIGLEIGIQDGRPIVIAPLEGSPAAQAGVRAGDFLLALNGHEVMGLSVAEIEDTLRGEVGSVVTLTVQHRDDSARADLAVVRDRILVETVRGFARRTEGVWDFMIEPENGIGYVRVSSFRKTTVPDFDAALTEMRRQGASALILDLRSNPGGVLAEAARLVDRFVSQGVIVSTVTRRGVERDYMAGASPTITNWNLIVLINGGTASAAEIVAGALQDHGRAIIVGERSFGKASVQRILRLTTNDAGINLTIAHYRLPSGRIIHRKPDAAQDDDWGIIPDVEVVLSREEQEAVHQSRLATRSDIQKAASTPSNANALGTAPRAEITRDRQLTTAIDLLRRRQQGEDVSRASRN